MAKLGTVHCGLSDCHFPEMDFFETRGSLEFSFTPAPPGSPESTAEVVVTARVDGVEPFTWCSDTGADVLRVETELAGSFGGVDGWSGRIPSSAVHQGEVLPIYY